MPFFRWDRIAREQLRAIERPQALLMLRALTDYATKGMGDVSALHGTGKGVLRLRCGDYRILFLRKGPDSFQVLKVGHRRDIYR
jgi:mRNA-degrading endonuclease RelE of RelBE toxin-antitoxin system